MRTSMSVVKRHKDGREFSSYYKPSLDNALRFATKVEKTRVTVRIHLRLDDIEWTWVRPETV